jgi:hypothetical protein
MENAKSLTRDLVRLERFNGIKKAFSFLKAFCYHVIGALIE